VVLLTSNTSNSIIMASLPDAPVLGSATAVYEQEAAVVEEVPVVILRLHLHQLPIYRHHLQYLQHTLLDT
jgi:hypothetical protein